MSKIPRLHDDCTLIEAAEWLSEETTEQWSDRAVIARLAYEWAWKDGGENCLLPESLRVAIPPGTVLENRITGRREISERWRMMSVGGAAIKTMLVNLLQFGEATEAVLVDGIGTRWLCQSPLGSDCLRLSPTIIDALVPEFDRLVQSAAAVKIVSEWEAVTVAEDQHDHDGAYLQGTTKKAIEAGLPSDAPTPTKEDESPWKAQARQRAKEIIKRQRDKDLFPSQLDIADEIAREFRAAGIYGSGGKALTGAYIKRHALHGISSQQAKLQSVAPRRGK